MNAGYGGQVEDSALQGHDVFPSFHCVDSKVDAAAVVAGWPSALGAPLTPSYTIQWTPTCKVGLQSPDRLIA